MSKLPRYPVIFNPKARSHKGGRVRSFLESNEDRFELFATEYPGNASEIAKKFADEGRHTVLAAGGDGTLNEVVQGLAGSKTICGVIPGGTMNVFAREMGIPTDSLDKALEIIDSGQVREIDLFEVNGKAFVQMAGVGIDAQVIEETSWESKKRLGPLAYLLSAVKVLGEKPPMMEIQLPDGRKEVGVAVLAGNGSLYGGQFKFFRKADNQDSILDVLVYKESGYKLVLDSLRGLAFGGIDLMKSTSYFQTESFIVTSGQEMSVEVDGEWLGRFDKVAFKETASRLHVYAPDGPLSGNFAETLRSIFTWPKRETSSEVSEKF